MARRVFRAAATSSQAEAGACRERRHRPSTASRRAFSAACLAAITAGSCSPASRPSWALREFWMLNSSSRARRAFSSLRWL